MENPILELQDVLVAVAALEVLHDDIRAISVGRGDDTFAMHQQATNRLKTLAAWMMAQDSGPFTPQVHD
jgi:hypothetical protein